MLNRRKTNLWKTNQKRIAIIYPKADEGNSGKDMRGDERLIVLRRLRWK